MYIFPLEDGHKTETCSGYWIKYSNQCCVRRKTLILKIMKVKKKNKAIPVTGRGGLWGCEILRIPHCLENRLTEDDNVVNLCTGPALLPRNIISLLLVLISVTGWVNPHGLVRLEGLGKLKIVIHLIGSQTCDLPDSNSVTWPTTLLRVPVTLMTLLNSAIMQLCPFAYYVIPFSHSEHILQCHKYL
jgi:hypothetical protein